MWCPYCGDDRTNVVYTRKTPSPINDRRRLYRCRNCGGKFHTVERIVKENTVYGYNRSNQKSNE